MSDERLREAERRWKESGSVDDEARYLLERVRVGDLTRERLELAAYCGHEGAARASESHAPALTTDRWLRGLSERWGVEALARVWIESARARLAEWNRSFPGVSAPQAAIDAGEALLLCPCRVHAEAAVNAAHGAGLVSAMPVPSQDAIDAAVAQYRATPETWERWNATPAACADIVAEAIDSAVMAMARANIVVETDVRSVGAVRLAAIAVGGERGRSGS